MSKKKMPNSVRKYIRREKARIRREILDPRKQEELINNLYDNRRNTQFSNKPGN